MKSFGRDTNNDLVLVRGNLSVVSDLQATLQVCEHVAKARFGEMVLATNRGMPYFETIWDGTPVAAPFEAAFRQEVSQVSGVVEISALTVTFEGDVARYSAEIVTVYGTGVING